MNLSDKEKAKQGAEALSIFFNQLGPPDTYIRIMWEELFKEMRNENLPVSSEKGQEGDKDNSSPKK